VALVLVLEKPVGKPPSTHLTAASRSLSSPQQASGNETDSLNLANRRYSPKTTLFMQHWG
jgi:hypothetical protein